MTVSGRLVGVCDGVENSSGGSVGAGVRLGWGLGVGVAASWVLFSLAPGVNIASSGGKSAYLISACRTVRRHDSLSCTKGMFETRIANTTRSRDAKKNHNQRGMRPLFRACSGFNLNMERLYPNQCPLLISCPSHGGINGLGRRNPSIVKKRGSSGSGRNQRDRGMIWSRSGPTEIIEIGRPICSSIAPTYACASLGRSSQVRASQSIVSQPGRLS